MKKRFFATFLCLCMIFAMLPTAALAADAVSVWICGVELNSTTPYYHNGTNGAQGTANTTEAGYNAYYDTESGILNLNGLTVTDSAYTKTFIVDGESLNFTYAICADGNLKINLSGNSIISTANSAGSLTDITYIIALGVNGNLSVTGNGSLSATSGSATNQMNYMVRIAAIYVQENLTVSGGTITGTGGAATAIWAESVGVFALGNTSVTGGRVTGIGGNVTGGTEASEGGYSEGISIDKDITVSGGILSGTGGAASGNLNQSLGVYADNIISSDTGSISATGGTSGQMSCGIYVTKNIVDISGGNVTAVGGESAESCGVYAYENSIIKFSDGTFTAKATGSGAVKTALNKSLTRADGITVKGSTASNGSNPVNYSDADNGTYLWVSAFKTPAKADYSAVDAAIKSIPSDLSGYTDASVSAVTLAVSAVVRDKDASDQSVVDAYAVAIQQSVGNLVKKSTEATVSHNPPGDSNNIAFWITLLFISGGILSVLIIKNKRKHRQLNK